MPEVGSAPEGPSPFVGRRAETAALASVLSRLGRGPGRARPGHRRRGDRQEPLGGGHSGAGAGRRAAGRGRPSGTARPARRGAGGLRRVPPGPADAAAVAALPGGVVGGRSAASGDRGDPLGRLSDLLRPTTNRPAPAAPSAGPGWDRLAVSATSRTARAAAADEAPLVLVIEDVHWADPETLRPAPAARPRAGPVPAGRPRDRAPRHRRRTGDGAGRPVRFGVDPGGGPREQVDLRIAELEQPAPEEQPATEVEPSQPRPRRDAQAGVAPAKQAPVVDGARAAPRHRVPDRPRGRARARGRSRGPGAPRRVCARSSPRRWRRWKP